MIIMGVDFGDARTGLAICDKGEMLASPVCVVSEKDFTQCQEKVAAVVMWDERCTTVSAHSYLNVTNTRGKKRKAVVDAVAATIILESYLAYRKNQANS